MPLKGPGRCRLLATFVALVYLLMAFIGKYSDTLGASMPKVALSPNRPMNFQLTFEAPQEKKYEYFLEAENCKWFYSYKYMHKSLAAVLNNTNEAVGGKKNFLMPQIYKHITLSRIKVCFGV